MYDGGGDPCDRHPYFGAVGEGTGILLKRKRQLPGKNPESAVSLCGFHALAIFVGGKGDYTTKHLVKIAGRGKAGNGCDLSDRVIRIGQ